MRWLGHPTFTWDDLWAIVNHLPATSALQREIDGLERGWSIADALEARALDAIRVGTWVAAGGRRRDYPKPTEIPGWQVDGTPQRQIFRGDAMTIEEMDRRLAQYS